MKVAGTALLTALLVTGGGAAQQAPLCQVVKHGVAIPSDIRETSGLAMGRLNPHAFWTHNDGSAPRLFAIDRDGRLLGTIEIRGARMRDWEDLAAGSCESGSCLYGADTGDNLGTRRTITIYEIPEPRLGETSEVTARALPAGYPDGAHDAEALFRAPNGDLFIVTKGRGKPIRLYRYPMPYRYDQVVQLEYVRDIAPRPKDDRDRVSAATITPDGRWVAILTYRTLLFYRTADLLSDAAAKPLTFDLSPLRHDQAEAVVVGADGSVWLTTESEKKGTPAWSQLHCTLPRN